MFVRVSRGVLLHGSVPLLFRLGSLVLATRKVVVHLVRDAELLTGIEPELGFNVGDLLVAERLAVSGAGVGFTRREADDGTDVQKDRLALELLGSIEPVEDGGKLRRPCSSATLPLS